MPTGCRQCGQSWIAVIVLARGTFAVLARGALPVSALSRCWVAGSLRRARLRFQAQRHWLLQNRWRGLAVVQVNGWLQEGQVRVWAVMAGLPLRVRWRLCA